MALTDGTPENEAPRKTGAGAVRFLHGRVGAMPEDRLPRGQHDLPRQFVADHQRTRIMEAMTDALYEIGFLDLTVADVVKRARVSRRTFYEHFDDKRHCFLATFGTSVECIAEAVRQVYAVEGPWEKRTAAGLSTLMQMMVEFPGAGYVCLVEGGMAGTEAARLAAARMCADGLAAIVNERDPSRPARPLDCELAIGALCELIRSRISEHRESELVAVLPDVAVALLSGLVGHEDARAVAACVERDTATATASPQVARS